MVRYKIKARYSALSPKAVGIFYMILSCFFTSVMVAIVRHLSSEFHIFFIVMVRNFFGLLFFMPQILRGRNGILKTQKLGLHIFRGVNGLASMIIWFYVITLLPLSEAVSISFVIPIITTAAAVIFLKEKVHSSIWIGSFIGFVGIVTILRPGFREFNIAYFYCIFSVSLWVISNLLIKTMTKTEKPQTIVAYMSLVMLICSIPFAIHHMKPISFEYLIWFAVLGIVSNLTHIFISSAYSKTDLSILQPFDFTRLIFISIISYFAFGEKLDIWVLFGSLIILIGIIFASPKKKNKDNVEAF